MALPARTFIVGSALVLAAHAGAQGAALTTRERMALSEAMLIADVFVAARYPEYEREGVRIVTKIVGETFEVTYLPPGENAGGSLTVILTREGAEGDRLSPRTVTQGPEGAMRQALHSFEVSTKGKGLVDITAPIAEWVSAQGIATGLLTVFCRHTSASLLIQENADPDVRTDLETFFEQLAPEDPRRYVHASEGADDMPAHIRICPHPGLASDPGRRGPARPRYMAGNLPFRAPPGVPTARNRPSSHRRIGRARHSDY